MKYENIKQSLKKVLALIEDCEHNGMSAVEYDLILKELRDTYSAVRFECRPAGETAEQAVAAEPQAAEPVQEEVPVCEPAEPAAEPAQEEPKADDAQARRRMTVRSLYESLLAAPAAKQEETAEPEAAAEPEPEKAAEEAAPEVVEEAAPAEVEATEAAEPAEEVVPVEPAEEEPAPAESEEEKPEETDETTVVDTPESVSEPEPEPEPAAATEEEAKEETAATEAEAKEEATAAEEPAEEEKATEPEPEHEPESEHAPAHSFTAENHEPVLGDLINADVQTFADTITPPEETAADIVGKGAIANLTEALGINDRFLLIRDLFDGDASAFEAAMEKLNSFGSFEECMIHIIENYEWDPHCEGAKLMMTLIGRRYADNA